MSECEVCLELKAIANARGKNISDLNGKITTLRAEVERLRAKVTELSDEAYEYAEQVESMKVERDEARANRVAEK